MNIIFLKSSVLNCFFSLLGNRKKLALSILFFSVAFVLHSGGAVAQTTIRYQESIKGGVTLIGNSWFSGISEDEEPQAPNADIDGDATTTWSSSSDLILPANSIIEKAYLSIEKDGGVGFSSVKLKVPGASTYTTLSTTTALVSRVADAYNQSVFDITSMMPANGYVSVAGGGAAGRYFVADPLSVPTRMGGWSIIVVYRNANSKFRNITVADDWKFFINSSTSFNLTGLKVPASGTVKAVVGMTGTYGDRGYADLLNFGLTSGTLTSLADPMTGATVDAMNSSIAMTVNNNVTQDGGPSMSGNTTTRNPISPGHFYGAAESYDYDADVFDATGVLAASATPINVTVQQQSTGGDVLISGSYFISIDLATPPVLTKILSPTTILDGGTATYTWTIANTATDAVTQTGLGFLDTLPSSIKVAGTPNITITGGSGAVVTAVAGSGTVSLSSLTLNAGQTATISVNVTNTTGALNASCSSNPAAFTNSSTNMSNEGVINVYTITPQCLVVQPNCNAETTAPALSATTKSNTCPATTVDLTTITATNLPANTTLTWHSGTPATTANKVAGTAVAAGTYYAAFFDATNDCYSTATTAVTATVTACSSCNVGSEVPSLIKD